MVSRSKYLINGTDYFKADISSFDETLESLKGSDIVYLCAGLPYDNKIWAMVWPKIMQNAIDACIKADAKLIFFDNKKGDRFIYSFIYFFTPDCICDIMRINKSVPFFPPFFLTEN